MEFKDLPRDIDEDLSTPIPYMKKTHKYTKATMRKGYHLKTSYRNLKRYKGA